MGQNYGRTRSEEKRCNLKRHQVLIQAITATAALCGKVVDEFGMDLYVTTLAETDDEQFARVLGHLRDCYKSGRLPTVNELENVAYKRSRESDEVQEAVALVCASISRHGSNNPAQARQSIGELGWAIVQRFGGWQEVCAVPSMKDLSILRAQMIKVGEAVSHRAKLGLLQAPPPGLPEENTYGLSSAESIVKDMFLLKE